MGANYITTPSTFAGIYLRHYVMVYVDHVPDGVKALVIISYALHERNTPSLPNVSHVRFYAEKFKIDNG